MTLEANSMAHIAFAPEPETMSCHTGASRATSPPLAPEENILTMSESDDCQASLADMYSELMVIGERLKSGILGAINKDLAEKTKRQEEGIYSSDEEDEEEEEDEESQQEDVDRDEDEDEDEEKSDDEAEGKEPKKNNKKEKPTKPLTDLERLLKALELGKQQKQHLMIKKAILLKFEEVLFGNNNITMTVDLRQLGDEEKEGKLEEILQCKNLSRYLEKTVTEHGNTLESPAKAAYHESVSVAESPPDILKPFRPKTPKKIAVNIIKQQYNIRWNTKTGESKPFDFFTLPNQFCKGPVRKAYIQTTLYEKKASIVNLPSTLNATGPLENEDFCPPFAYVKKDPYALKDSSDGETIAPVRLRDEPKFTWQRWTIQTDGYDELGSDFPAELKWIDPKVKTLIKKLCHPIADDFSVNTTENVMYLFVLNDTTSPILAEEGNRSQVYIGGADEGLRNKLLEGDDCHCSRIKQLYHHFSNIESFTPNSAALLIELRMLLAMVRREQYALFVLQAFADPRSLGRELHDLVIQTLVLANNCIWGPAVNMKFGLNVKEELKKRKKFLPDHFPGSNRNRKKKK